jgi:hypothetical protein
MKYRKTELGQQIFKDRNASLSVAQRSAFIMFDGEKDDTVILKSLSVMGLSIEDIKHLLELGLIEAVGGANMASQPKAVESVATAYALPSDGALQAPAMSEQERYQRAYLVASKLTSGLGLRGFRLNLSVGSASSYKDLTALAPKIRDAVGDEKFAELAKALSAT